MTKRASICAVSVLVVLCSAVVTRTSALSPEEKPEIGRLRLVLRLDESGEARLFLDMPLNKDILELLITGQETPPAVFVKTELGTNTYDILKATSLLGSLGVHPQYSSNKRRRTSPEEIEAAKKEAKRRNTPNPISD